MLIQFMVNMSRARARWYFNFSKWTPSYPEILLASSCIQPEEKVRLGKFVFQKDIKASLIGRLMMRKFVSDTCTEHYDSLKFERDKNGRPFLKTKKNMCFNVSHQGEFTVLAGEPDDLLLGVDVMKFEYSGGKPLKEFFRIMNRNFSTAEWRQIYSFSDEKSQLNTFCRLWALKESYTKAIGLGITIRLDEISFKLNSTLNKETLITDTELHIKGFKLENWFFQEMLIDDFHCVAVATNKKIDEIIFKEITFKELMENAKPLIPQDEKYCLEYFKKESKAK